MQALPFERRVVVLTNLLENEIANGGLAQFLWNYFSNWEYILTESQKGYAAFGAPQAAAAIDELIQSIRENYSECEKFVQLAIANHDFKYFQNWYDIAESKMTLTCEDIFCDYDELSNLRQNWLSKINSQKN